MSDNAEKTSSFKSLITTLGEVAVDFSKLTVTTATGDIEAALKSENVDLKSVDMEELFKKAVSGSLNGTLIIAAVDSYKLDGDAFIFRSNNPAITEEQRENLEFAHTSAINTGQSLRDGIIDIVQDGIRTLLLK